MIILDTNVVSEPLKPAPNLAVLNWLDAQEPTTLYLTAINWAELLAGVAILAAGRRKEALTLALSTQVLDLFKGRILPFDVEAAQAFAKNHASTQSQGLNMGFADSAIASIASAHGYAIATRNVRDFSGTGLELIDPWAFK